MSRYFSSIFLIEAVVIDSALFDYSEALGDPKNKQRLIICRDWEKYFDFFYQERPEEIFENPKRLGEWLYKRRIPEFLSELNKRLKKSFPLEPETKKEPNRERSHPLENRNLSERSYELDKSEEQEAEKILWKLFDEFYTHSDKDWRLDKDDFKKDIIFKRTFDEESFFSDNESLFRIENDFPMRGKPLSSKLEGIFFDTMKQKGPTTRKFKSLERLIRTGKIPRENVFFVEIPIPKPLRKYADVKESSSRYEIVFFERGEYVFRLVDNEIRA